MYMLSTPYGTRPPVVDPAQERIAFDREVAGPISSARVVYASAAGIDLADKDTLTVQDKILGLTLTSAAGAGESVTILGEGYSVDPSYSFSPGAIWLGNSGLLTQTPPTSGLWIQLGVALSATELYFNIGLAIRLA